MILPVTEKAQRVAAQHRLLATPTILQRLSGSQGTGGVLHAQTLSGAQTANAPIGAVLINGWMQPGSRDALGQAVKLLSSNVRAATVQLNATAQAGTQTNDALKLHARFPEGLSEHDSLLVIRAQMPGILGECVLQKAGDQIALPNEMLQVLRFLRRVGGEKSIRAAERLA